MKAVLLITSTILLMLAICPDRPAQAELSTLSSSNVHNILNAAELIGRCNGTGGYERATSGDTLLLPNGTLDARSAPLSPAAGVNILGQGRSASKVRGQFTASGSRTLKGFTLDSSGLPRGLYGANDFFDGTILLEDMEILSNAAPGQQNLLTFVARYSPCVATMRHSIVRGAETDCVSTKAPEAAAMAAASKLELYDCEVYDGGSTSTSNLLTVHDGFGGADYNGYYHSGNAPRIIQPDQPTTKLYLYGTKTLAGGENGTNGTVSAWYIGAGCDITGDVRPYNLMEDTIVRFNVTTYGAAVLIDQDDVMIRRCQILGTVNEAQSHGILIFAGTGARIEDCLIQNAAAKNMGGIRIDSSIKTFGTYRFFDNRVENCYHGIHIRTEGKPAVYLSNNLISGSINKNIYTNGPYYWFMHNGNNNNLGLYDAYIYGSVVPHIPGDYNKDGIVDLADYNLWADHYGEMRSIPGDFNGNGIVDLADYTIWADHYGKTGNDIPGDANGDGVVNLADYTVWADYYGKTRELLPGDGNNDGSVNLADYTLWSDHYGDYRIEMD